MNHLTKELGILVLEDIARSTHPIPNITVDTVISSKRKERDQC